MTAAEALELFKERPASDILRLLEVFAEEEDWRLQVRRSFAGPAAAEKGAAPFRYGGEGTDRPVPSLPESPAAAPEGSRGGTRTDPAGTYGGPVEYPAGSGRRILFEGTGKTAKAEEFSTFPTVKMGKTPCLSTVSRDDLPITEPERTGRAEDPPIPTVDELLDELERRLIRELQIETEGIYR